MKTSNHASKYVEWKAEYNWDTCKTNRKEYGQFIAHFLTTGSRVINLDGVYGSGKTEFIRRLYIELATRGHPVVYIDVWESDFSTNPLAVICSELLQQIEYVFKEKTQNGKIVERRKATEVFDKLKSKLGICLQYAAAGLQLYGDTSSASELATVGGIVAGTPELSAKPKPRELVEIIQKNHIEAVQAIKEIKGHITFLSHLIKSIYELNIPIVIFIDELDRCRPSYAIEVLEVIKHFFETEGCTFLVATNTEVLEHSIKAVYGSEFNAKFYLRRFFDRKVKLPQVSVLDYLIARQLDFDKYKSDYIHLFPFTKNYKKNISVFAALFESNRIELRGVEQILNRFFASLEYVASTRMSSDVAINTIVLMVGLIEQHLEMSELVRRQNSSDLSFSLNLDNNTNLPLAQMVDVMFKCVMQKSAKKEYLGHNQFREYSTFQPMLGIKSIDFRTIDIFNGQDDAEMFRSLLSKSNEGSDCNYWMWEDHKKIIELSGHIQ
ncbi:KAP family P-loop NTPase fold protein [Shewanella mangrovisoli]|uniref:KAP family P-loop NTPase fold protein n=1 Tax=Shewanella mangrovisoli TaxID=2864211 RepID=UPI0035BC746B